MRQQFFRTSSGLALNFQRPGLLLQDWIFVVGLTWVVVGTSEGKERFVPKDDFVEPRDLLNEFPQLIVISFIYYQYAL